jgi:hypothetical protein
LSISLFLILCAFVPLASLACFVETALISIAKV